jgi:hypothetical protein
MRTGKTLLGALLFAVAAVGAQAQTNITPSISGNTLTARIQLAGGIEGDLSMTFEQAVGLNANALTISAALVDPTDAALLARLPGPLVSVPAAFPVLVRVDPTPASGLSFSGVYRISLYTHALTLATNSPLRLYQAPTGGSFQDVTSFLELGSVRAGGGPGSMSEFLIVADTRPVDSVIAAKFDGLQAALTSNASSMPQAVANDLQQRLSNARALYSAGTLAAAIDAVAGFSTTVKNQSGTAIPDVWRANGGLINVAGLLRCGADTLKFSLSAKANGAP